MRFSIFSHDRQVLKQLCFLAKIYFRNQKKLLTVSLVLGFFAETMAMLMPQLTGNLAATLQDWKQFRTAAFYFLGVGLVQFLFAVTNDVFDRLLKDRLERDAYSFTHEKLLTMDPAYYQNNTSGELLLNLNSGTGIAYELLELICFPVFYGSGMVVGLIFLFQSLRNIHLPLWLVAALVAGMAVQPFQTWFFGKLIAKAYTKVRESGKQINEEILNDLHAPVELHLMNAVSGRIKQMFSIRHLLALRMDKAMLLHIASRYSMSLLILLFQFAIVISVLMNYDLQGAVVRDLIASILLIPLMFNHLNKLQQMYNGVKDQEPYIAAVYGLFQTRNELPDGTMECPGDLDAGIKLEGIGFSYSGGPQVLNGVSLSMRPGRTYALISASGEGKSTILKLISRLYLPENGTITWGNVDIFDIREHLYRKDCVLCSQFPLFIKGTVRDNFKLQNPDITDREIMELCRKTGLDSILSVPEKQIPEFELTLGADNLSGGQKRLLAVARCLSLHPRILLLDEPSAGVDGPTMQKHLIPLLKRIKNEKILIAAADHNINFLSAVADEAFILENGKIIEHDEIEKLRENGESRFRQYEAKWNDLQKMELNNP